MLLFMQIDSEKTVCAAAIGTPPRAGHSMRQKADELCADARGTLAIARGNRLLIDFAHLMAALPDYDEGQPYRGA